LWFKNSKLSARTVVVVIAVVVVVVVVVAIVVVVVVVVVIVVVVVLFNGVGSVLHNPTNTTFYYGFYRAGFLLIEVLWNPLLRFGSNFAKNYKRPPPPDDYTGSSSYCY
jgi:hypothetical protein